MFQETFGKKKREKTYLPKLQMNMSALQDGPFPISISSETQESLQI